MAPACCSLSLRQDLFVHRKTVGAGPFICNVSLDASPTSPSPRVCFKEQILLAECYNFVAVQCPCRFSLVAGLVLRFERVRFVGY